MPISPFNAPININICKGDGTIFSTSSTTTGSGPVLSFSNLGLVGARVYAQTIFNNIQFRRIKQGRNTLIVEEGNDILVDTPDIAFDASLPIKRQFLQGVVLGTQGVAATLQKLLYPIIAPTVSINLSPTVFEFGDNTNLTASWNVIKNDETINSIFVFATLIAPITGNSQSGQLPIAKTGNANQTVNIQATTLTSHADANTTALVSRKLRYGSTTKDGTIVQILDSDINGLLSQFNSTGKLSPIQLVIPANQYLIIEIPVALNATPPVFKVNGFINNAFVNVRTNSAFVNSFGFSDPVNIWVSAAFATGTIQLEID